MHKLLFVTAPSGAPQNITNTSITSTSITIQWEEVECRERNGEISGYQVQLVHNSLLDFMLNTSDQSYTAQGLLPCTNYTFNVSAINSVSSGPPGNTTVRTSVPQGQLQVAILLYCRCHDYCIALLSRCWILSRR